VRRLLRDPTAVALWFAVTLAGVVVALVVGHSAWAVAGWAVGGVAAAVLVSARNTPPARALTYAWTGPLPPGAHQERDHGEQRMADEQEQRRIEVDRADRALIEQAAARLRQDAILAAYAGMERKELAFCLALILDELALHVRDLDAALRAQVLEGARMLARE
jgi:hypothetical protein